MCGKIERYVLRNFGRSFRSSTLAHQSKETISLVIEFMQAC